MHGVEVLHPHLIPVPRGSCGATTHRKSTHTRSSSTAQSQLLDLATSADCCSLLSDLPFRNVSSWRHAKQTQAGSSSSICAAQHESTADSLAAVCTACCMCMHTLSAAWACTHSLLVMGSMNSSGSILLQGSSGPSPIAASHSTNNNSLWHQCCQEVTTVPAAAALPAACHVTCAVLCCAGPSWLCQAARRQGLAAPVPAGQPSPLRRELPPYLRKSSTGTTIVVWMVGRTCVVTCEVQQ